MGAGLARCGACEDNRGLRCRCAACDCSDATRGSERDGRGTEGEASGQCDADSVDEGFCDESLRGAGGTCRIGCARDGWFLGTFHSRMPEDWLACCNQVRKVGSRGPPGEGTAISG